MNTDFRRGPGHPVPEEASAAYLARVAGEAIQRRCDYCGAMPGHKCVRVKTLVSEELRFFHPRRLNAAPSPQESE